MSYISRIRADHLLRHNTVFFFGSLFVAVINYLYYPVLGRMLSVDDFGEVTAIFSLVAQVGVLLSVFNMVAIHLASNAGHKARESVLDDIYTLVFWIQVAALFVLVVASPYLRQALQFDSQLPFYLLALNSLVALPYALLSSAMQGKKQFGKLTRGSLMQSGGKLVFSVILVFLGAGVLGAIGGLVIAQLVTLYYFGGRSLRHIHFFPKIRPTYDRALKSELRYGALVFIATSMVTLLTTADTVYVKYFFPPDIAGEYSGISVIARILFFVTASIAAVLLPSITLRQTKEHNYRILGKSALLVVSIGGIGLLCMVIFPELIIRLLLGVKYLPFAHLLPGVALMMFFASCINLLFIFLLALRRYILLLTTLSGMIVLSVPFFRAPDSVASIVRYFLSVDVLILVLLVGYLIYDYTKEQKTSLDHHPAS